MVYLLPRCRYPRCPSPVAKTSLSVVSGGMVVASCQCWMYATGSVQLTTFVFVGKRKRRVGKPSFIESFRSDCVSSALKPMPRLTSRPFNLRTKWQCLKEVQGGSLTVLEECWHKLSPVMSLCTSPVANKTYPCLLPFESLSSMVLLAMQQTMSMTLIKVCCLSIHLLRQSTPTE